MKTNQVRSVLLALLGTSLALGNSNCPCPGDTNYAGEDACGNDVCDAADVDSYPYTDACGNGVCDPLLDGEYPDTAYDCDGDGELDSCEPCVSVTFDGLATQLLRGESGSAGFTVTPSSKGSDISISVSGNDANTIPFTINEPQLKIDYENIISEADPVAFMDEQVVTVTASIPDEGSWSWTETLKLKKGLDSAWSAGKQEAVRALENVDPGEFIGNRVSRRLKDFSAVDAEGLVYEFTSSRINSAVSQLKGDISSEWGGFVDTFIWTGIPMTDVEAITVNENFAIRWNTDVLIEMAGGNLSLSPSLSDAWQWVESVNDSGFNSELFNLNKTIISGSVSGDGSTSAGDLSADLNFFIRVDHSSSIASGGFEWGIGITVNLDY